MTTEHTSNNDSYPQTASVGPRSENCESTAESAEVQQLTWSLCDGLITDDELRRLENLLIHSEKARSEYLSIVSIHQSLVEIFNPKTFTGIHGLLPT